MTATGILIILAELLGGLAFFLYGMSAMSSGLEQMAGGALERTLKKVTKNDFISFFLGAGITVAIQSSSAMTVMLVGLVNSGIMAFSETFGMIMGSHVGTTLTAWILTLTGISGENFFLVLLKPTTFAPILAFVGIVLRMVAKKEKKKNLGVIFIGFAVLMAGMELMSNSMSGFKDNESFINLLTAFSKSPMLAFLVSTAFTGIIQSSAATVAIVQALALAALGTGNPMSYQLAIPLVLGANVGTCMTALLSSIGTKCDAKRVVAMHIYTNAIGGIIGVALMYVVRLFNPTLMLAPIGIVGVAVVHSLFNIINTIAFVPFKNPMIKLCKKTIKSDKAKEHTVFLDERIFYKPSFAVSECRRLAVEMAIFAHNSVKQAIELLSNFDSKKSDNIIETEAVIDEYEDKLGTYLVKIGANELSASETHTVGRLLHGIGDFERIGDHALNLRDAAQEIHDKKIIFTKDAKVEIKTITDAISEILDLTMESFLNDDTAKAARVEPLEQVIDSLMINLKSKHVERLQKGECTIKLGFVFTDIISNCERISDHCSNIAVYTLQSDSEVLDSHNYLSEVKTHQTGEYKEYFEYYGQKYKV